MATCPIHKQEVITYDMKCPLCLSDAPYYKRTKENSDASTDKQTPGISDYIWTTGFLIGALEVIVLQVTTPEQIEKINDILSTAKKRIGVENG